MSDTSTIETAVHALADLLMASQNTVFFTGAGISTESGIPDFRSPGTGLWNKIRPIEFQDFVNSAESRQESWERKFANDVMASPMQDIGRCSNGLPWDMLGV